MTKLRRILNILMGLGMILCAIAFALFPEGAYKIVVLILAVSLLFYGIRMFFFYLSMARHMVGGRSVLYRSILIFDLGLFTLTLTDVPLIYVILYLVGLNLFTGGIDIMQGLEARKMQSSWKLQFVHGLICILMAALCLAFLHSTATAVLIYAIGLAYSGVTRIIRACRRTAIVYIQ